MSYTSWGYYALVVILIPIYYEPPKRLRWTDDAAALCVKEKPPRLLSEVFCVGVDLSFQSVARQVFSALVSLTSVFGMGTGGPSPLKTPTMTEKTCCSFLLF